MANETGHAVNMGNFEDLLEYVQNIPNYNPSNSELLINALKAKITGVRNETTILHQLNAKKIISINERQVVFDRPDLYATRIQSAVDACEIVDKKFQADVKTILRKVKGQRAKPKEDVDPNKPAEEQQQYNSASQQSMDNQIDHFEKIIELLTAQPNYSSNEEGLSVADITAHHQSMIAVNKTAVKDETAAKKQEVIRNTMLYDKEKGLLATAAKVKNYVRTIKNLSPAIYKKIKGIPFRYYKI